MKRILFLFFLFASSVLQAAEFEVVDQLTVDGATTLKSSVVVIVPNLNLPLSLWVSTSAITPHLYVSTNGNVGIGTTGPDAQIDIQGTADNSGPASMRMSGASVDNGYMHEETFRITGITSATEISRITGTGCNGLGMTIEIVVGGHTGSLGSGMVRGVYFYEGGTSAPTVVQSLPKAPAPVISFDTSASNVLIVKLRSSDGVSSFKGVMNIRWYVPVDFSENTWTIQ